MTQTRDQKRAAHAYKCVSEVEPSLRKDYNARVNGLGAQVIRSGLAATVAFLERDRDSAAVKLLFKHLLDANIPGVKRDPRTPAQDETRVVPDSVRALELEDLRHPLVSKRPGIVAFLPGAPDDGGSLS